MERRVAEQLAQRWLNEGIRDGNLATFDELLSGDAATLEAIKQRASVVHSAFADIQTSLDELLVEGERLAWRWTITGTHVGSFGGVPATGRRVTLRGVNFQRLEQGRVAEHWTLADTHGLLEALRRAD